MPGHPFLDQIDHLGIQADDPAQLFQFFSQVLDLPVVFPFVEYPYYTSGSVTLGNMFLELMRFGKPKRSGASTPNAAQYHILGFLIQPNTITQGLGELDRRGLPHSDIMPFFAPEATDHNPIKLWANVFLGGLLGENVWMRLFFSMSKRATPRPSVQRSRLANAMMLPLLTRSFRNGMPVLTEYYQHLADHNRAIDRTLLQQGQGGALGIEYVQEIVIGVPETAPQSTAWARLFDPLVPDETGLWSLGGGPALRFIPQSTPGIQTMVLKVTSLEQAKAFINQADLQMEIRNKWLTLTLPHTSGLTVQLTEI